MIGLALALGALAACFAFGLGVIGIFSAGRRPISTAWHAVPLGLAAWVCVVMYASLLPWGRVSLLAGLIVLGAVGAVGIVRLARRNLLLYAVRMALPTVLVAAAVSIMYLVPWLTDGSLAGALHFTSNHDAFHFGSGATWLLDHPATDVPRVGEHFDSGADSPAFSPAAGTFGKPLRFGFEAVFSSLLAVTGQSAYVAWPAVAAISAGLVGASGTGLALAITRRVLPSVCAGIAVGAAPMVVIQVANQNGASTMGIALALVFLTLWWQFLVTANDSQPRYASLALTGLALGATIAVYWEVLPSILIALILSGAWAGMHLGLRQAVIRLAVVIASCAVFAAYPLYVAARSLSTVGGANPVFRSPFIDEPASNYASWLLGTAHYGGPDASIPPVGWQLWLGLSFLLILTVGLGSVARVRGMAPIAGGLVVSLLGGWWWWGMHNPNPYTQRRFIECAAVLVIAAGAAGWARLATSVRGMAPEPGDSPGLHGENGHSVAARTPRIRAIVATVVLVSGASWYSAEAVTMQDAYPARGREQNYADTKALLERAPGPILVSVHDLLDQAWVALNLADRPNTQYLTPCSCLIGRTMQPYLSSARPASILIDTRHGTASGDIKLIARQADIKLLLVGSGAVRVRAQNPTGQTVEVAYPGLRKSGDPK
ncbi:MAG: hypothetical protein Q8P61_00490 [Candidatus Nanopelagicales bacterium]|nr:hypothetical protein [Candidatus Nanopelagicales bacterium]